MQFVVSFGPLFYTTYGLGSMAFTYNLIARILNLVFSLPVAWLYDKFGRRPLLFIGTFLSMIWLILVGALGGQDNLTDATVRTVVASVVLLQTCCYLGLSQGCWIVGPEIGSATMRRKSRSSNQQAALPFAGIACAQYSWMERLTCCHSDGSCNHCRHVIRIRRIVLDTLHAGFNGEQHRLCLSGIRRRRIVLGSVLHARDKGQVRYSHHVFTLSSFSPLPPPGFRYLLISPWLALIRLPLCFLVLRGLMSVHGLIHHTEPLTNWTRCLNSDSGLGNLVNTKLPALPVDSHMSTKIGWRARRASCRWMKLPG